MIKGLTEEENKALDAQIAKLPKEQQEIARKQLENMPLEELKKLFKPQCVFCNIAAGKSPTKKIYENKDTLAFLNIFPAAEGHVLLPCALSPRAGSPLPRSASCTPSAATCSPPSSPMSRAVRYTRRSACC